MQYLLIKAFKFPHTLSSLIDFVPPSQADENPSAHILHHPEINRAQNNGDDKNDHEVFEKQGRQNVEYERCRLQIEDRGK